MKEQIQLPKFGIRICPFCKQIDIQHAKIDEQNIHSKKITRIRCVIIGASFMHTFFSIGEEA
jgi:hypothetical protein